jgi:hypothetical protein
VGFDALLDREVKMPVGRPRQAAILATSLALAIAFGSNAWQQVAVDRSIGHRGAIFIELVCFRVRDPAALNPSDSISR